MTPTRHRLVKVFAAGWLVVTACASEGCSPGTLPGSPTTFSPGGGARYTGTLTITRLAGPQVFGTGPRPLDMSLVVGPGDQINGQASADDATVTLNGVITGTMSAGSFSGRAAVTLPVVSGGVPLVCEGRASVVGQFTARNLALTLAPPFDYDNCGGLLTVATGQATAISPVPSTPDRLAGQARLMVITPETSIATGTCNDGAGYLVTLTLKETAGVAIDFDATYQLFRVGPVIEAQMPIRRLEAGEQRAIEVCAPPGFFLAEFTGRDAGGARIRVPSPQITLGDPTRLADWGTFSTAVIDGAAQLQLCVRDNADPDGDILRVSVNGQLVVERTLSTASFCQNVRFNAGTNTIAVTAVNEGTAPPNTGEISVSALAATGEPVAATTLFQSYQMLAGQTQSSNIVVTAIQ